MTPGVRVGVIGGTFDPIHLGHLAAGRAAAAALALDEVRFLPSRIPPHRSDGPTASPYHRFAMVALALGGEPDWRAADDELRRDGPSYTFDTLTALHRAGLAASQIFFITGVDAFAEVATWSRYPAVLDAAHFVVVTRPGTDVRALHARLPALADRFTTPDALGDAIDPRVILVEGDTPDVSSTDIRRRLRAHDGIDGLVPSPVARHIERHGLYGWTNTRRRPSETAAGR